MDFKDYYKTLGVPSNGSLEIIRTAYRKLSKKFHPDVNNGDKFFEEKFKEIQEAYEILSDTSKRKQYDYKRAPPLGARLWIRMLAQASACAITKKRYVYLLYEPQI